LRDIKSPIGYTTVACIVKMLHPLYRW